MRCPTLIARANIMVYILLVCHSFLSLIFFFPSFSLPLLNYFLSSVITPIIYLWDPIDIFYILHFFHKPKMIYYINILNCPFWWHSWYVGLILIFEKPEKICHVLFESSFVLFLFPFRSYSEKVWQTSCGSKSGVGSGN